MVLQTKTDKIEAMPRAMILAAGLGTRLRPLTDHTPKALLIYQGRTMLEHIILKLKSAGITEIIINIHHLADQIVEYVEANDSFGISIKFSDERDELLDTGGGIRKAKWFFEGSGAFIVHNIDIDSNLDIKALYDAHMSSGCLATLAVKQRPTSRNFLSNSNSLLAGWRNNQTREEIITREDQELSPTAFSCVHIMSEEIFSYLDQEGPFSITKKYLELSKQHPIYLYDHSQDDWTDMAHPSHYPEVK